MTKCDKSGLQNAMGFGLQIMTKWITSCDMDYKVRQEHKV